MSPNVQEGEAVGRKRSHDEFTGDLIKMDEGAAAKTPKSAAIRPTGDCLLPPQVQADIQSSPSGSPALTEAGSSTPARNSPSPLTPTKPASAKAPTDTDSISAEMVDSSSSAAAATKPPAPKRKRLSAEEKEAKDKEIADKKKEREEQAAKKAAEKAKQEEEKAARAKEREEQAALKAAEKAKQEEEKAARAKEREEKRKQKEEEERIKAEQRDEKRRKKEEEQRRLQEEKDKKARSQPKLNAFFKLPGTPKKSDNSGGDSAAASPSKSDAGAATTAKQPESEYEKLFKPFFLRENTRLALSPTNMDDETREAKSRILDGYIGTDGEAAECLPQFNAVDLFCLAARPPTRGRVHHPVKHIMECAYRETENAGGSGSSSSSTALQDAKRKLASIPVKIIAFSRDVRPPYYGTMTLKPFALGVGAMHKLARQPLGRRLPLDYDYDSEAEWQEEEGEDIDMDDDEEELDDEDDMDGFLDDSEDAGVSRRIFGNTIEPEVTGLCFENYHRLGPNSTVYEHKMEFMHDGLEQSWGIDPFSTQYWETDTKSKQSKGASQTSTETKAKMPPPPPPANAFEALSGTAQPAPAKLVKAELMNDVKQAILDNKALSKVGIIDFIFHQFRDSVSRAEVKNTIEHVAEKKGAGRSKEWDLKPGHEIAL